MVWTLKIDIFFPFASFKVFFSDYGLWFWSFLFCCFVPHSPPTENLESWNRSELSPSTTGVGETAVCIGAMGHCPNPEFRHMLFTQCFHMQ